MLKLIRCENLSIANVTHLINVSFKIIVQVNISIHDAVIIFGTALAYFIVVHVSDWVPFITLIAYFEITFV